MLRKISIIFASAFLILIALINSCPVVTQWDRSFIIFMQERLAGLPLWIPMLPDCVLYTAMIILPLLSGAIFFIKKRKVADLICFLSIPLVTFLLNCLLKPLIHRPRPPMELQITSIHPDSFSFVSSHSLVTICLWGMVIFYLIKYCRNKFLKISGVLTAILWIIFVGLSRVWIGVHNPTDVLGAYLLGLLLLSFYINLPDKVEHFLNIIFKSIKNPAE